MVLSFKTGGQMDNGEWGPWDGRKAGREGTEETK